MIILYAVTALTIILALFSIKTEPSFLAAAGITLLLGLITSGWQQKKKKKIPWLKSAVNLLLIALTISAFIPFFTKSSDILSGLIKTWVYFLVLATFTLYSKRDYYIIQGLSLGLVIFSCFSETRQAIIPLAYILGFFIIWIITLRRIRLIDDLQEVLHKGSWLLREFQIISVFIAVVLLLSLPLYLTIPHFEIPIPMLSEALEQKYSRNYKDFPKDSLVSFLGLSEKKITDQPGQDQGSAPGGKESESHLQPARGTAKPTFLHDTQPR